MASITVTARVTSALRWLFTLKPSMSTNRRMTGEMEIRAFMVREELYQICIFG
jgi:hypothetical protein